MQDIRYKWNAGAESVGISNEVQLPQFRVLGHRQSTRSIYLSTGKPQPPRFSVCVIPLEVLYSKISNGLSFFLFCIFHPRFSFESAAVRLPDRSWHWLVIAVGYTMRDIRYKWNEGPNSVGVSNEVSLPQFKVLGHRQRAMEVSLTTGT